MRTQAVNALEVFITEVERKLYTKMKIVRSDRGEKYNGRYDESGQHLDPFAMFLEHCCIFAKHIMTGTPQQNNVLA